MAELIDVFKALVHKAEWSKITDEDKNKNFFIINRYMSKKYPDKAQLLNLKTIDKVSALDLWYYFMLDEPYPNWFWSKGDKSDRTEIPEKDYKLLLQRLHIGKDDLDYLIQHHYDFVKSELKHFKEIEKR